MPLIIPLSFISLPPPCHPPCDGRGVVGLYGLLGLLAVGVMTPVSAASPRVPSVQSRETRVALLSIFDQLGAGGAIGNDASRSRANRRHPDVGFTSTDSICLSCVMTVLAPPVLPPPAPRQAPPPPAPQPKISSLPILPPPAPKPILPQPVASKPAAPKPPTILQSRLPAVLTPAKATIRNPLAAPPAPALIELRPLAFAMEAVPNTFAPVIPNAQVPVQTPGPLPILGAGMAFAASRRLRGRIKAARSRRMR